VVVELESASREKKREKSRDLVIGHAQEHLVNTGICHFNTKSSFSCIYVYYVNVLCVHCML
jgi:hypothetical protein